ncbi:hypothetical protein KAR34_00840 [bacterium]|nr:hypothetical protein [bacterium]
MTIRLTDFPKLYCPFIRQTFKVNQTQHADIGRKYSLKHPEVYLVVNQVNPGYEWVFEDEETFAVEKLNGTNIKLETDRGRLIALQNRLNPIDPLQIIKGKTYILDGIWQAAQKGYVQETGEQAGELIGPKVQGNPYRLANHLWYPFEKAVADLCYRSFQEHARTLENWSNWFKEHLFSRFFTKLSKKSETKEMIFAEGIVFYNLKRKSQNKTWRAKLRRDMFPWYYAGLEIYDYDSRGAGTSEDQEKFD